MTAPLNEGWKPLAEAVSCFPASIVISWLIITRCASGGPLDELLLAGET